MKNNERLKRNFVNYALQKNFNLSVNYADGMLRTICIKDEHDVEICNLAFSEFLSNAPVSINYVKNVSLDDIDKLVNLFHKIIDLYQDLSNEQDL